MCLGEVDLLVKRPTGGTIVIFAAVIVSTSHPDSPQTPVQLKVADVQYLLYLQYSGMVNRGVFYTYPDALHFLDSTWMDTYIKTKDLSQQIAN